MQIAVVQQPNKTNSVHFVCKSAQMLQRNRKILCRRWTVFNGFCITICIHRYFNNNQVTKCRLANAKLTIASASSQRHNIPFDTYSKRFDRWNITYTKCIYICLSPCLCLLISRLLCGWQQTWFHMIIINKLICSIPVPIQIDSIVRWKRCKNARLPFSNLPFHRNHFNNWSTLMPKRNRANAERSAVRILPEQNWFLQ